MALSADQQAMLQLLLERGQSYADISSLLGTPEDEVRGRARAALEELAGEDPDRNVGLTDYLLGQADPIGRADAARHLRDDPDDQELASEIATKLRELAPDARLPRLPGEPRPARARRVALPAPAERLRGRLPARLRRGGPAGRAASRAGGEPAPRGPLTQRQHRLIIGLISGGVILVAVVLAVAGAFGGGGGASTPAASTTGTTTGSNGSTTASATGNAVRVTLAPQQHPSNASGTATFATASGNQAYVELSLNGLQPPPQGKAYVAWLLLNGKVGHPLTPVTPGTNGGYDQRIALQDFQLPIAARAQFVDVSLEDIAALNRELKQALQKKTPVLPYTGTSVLRGPIPGAGGASGSGSSGGSG